MSRHDGGKGDTLRPLVIPMDKFDAQWDSIFGKKEKQVEPIPFAGMVEMEDEEKEDAK